MYLHRLPVLPATVALGLLLGAGPLTASHAVLRSEQGEPRPAAGVVTQRGQTGFTGILISQTARGRTDGTKFIPDGDPEIRIRAIVEGSPAATSGLAVGDVILELNGKPLRESGRALGRPEAGATYVFRVRRGEEELEFTVVAVHAPERPAS